MDYLVFGVQQHFFGKPVDHPLTASANVQASCALGLVREVPCNHRTLLCNQPPPALRAEALTGQAPGNLVRPPIRAVTKQAKGHAGCSGSLLCLAYGFLLVGCGSYPALFKMQQNRGKARKRLDSVRPGRGSAPTGKREREPHPNLPLQCKGRNRGSPPPIPAPSTRGQVGPLIVCVTVVSRILGFAGTDASLSRMAPKSLSRTGIRSGPNLPRVDAGLGHVPRPSCPGGLAMDSPSPPVCGRVYGDTLAQSFVFCNGGLAGFFLDGWSCCGQRPPTAEVWLGLRRYPAHSTLRRLCCGGHAHPRREPRVPGTLLWETGKAFARNCGGLAVHRVGAASPTRA